MKYIVTSKSGFVHLDDNLTITNDLNKAKRYNTIGEAMKDCADFNKHLGTITFKVYNIND